MNKKNKTRIIALIILAVATGCANFISVRPPNIDSTDVASAVNQAVDLSWENAQIAFFSTRPAKYLEKITSNTGFVFLMSDDGSQMAYLKGTFHSLESPAVWSPNGQKIIAVAYDDRVSSYCILLIEQTDTKCLVKDGYAPSWSRDGRKVAYYRQGNSTISPTLNVLDIESGESKSILDLPASKTNSLSTWAPDGNSLAYEVYDQVNAEEQIWIYSFLSSSRSFVTRGKMPAWSPRGSEITFIRDGKLWLLNLTTKQETRLLSEFKTISWPSWSFDGEKLLFVSIDTGDGDIYYLEWDSNKVVRVTNDSFSDEAPSWRP